jgi:phospholipid/cholesterol/gamma-HCH transport system substrate-binding protein
VGKGDWMKMRATNLMIGTTTLAVIAAGFIGLLGVRKIRTVSQETPMRIVFEGGSASGLRRGGSVNFDGVQIGEIISLELGTPRKVVADVRVDKNAPIRKDTVVGLEYQGLTGVAAISLTGGDSQDPPANTDGIPTLTADLSEIQSIRETLHNVDRVLVGNQTTIKDGLLSFETYTASLASRGDAIDQALAKANAAFAGFDNAIARIDDLLPGFGDGNADELFEKMREIREFAQTFDKKSATVMEEARQTLLDVSESANKVTLKLDPQISSPRPPRRQIPQR